MDVLRELVQHVGPFLLAVAGIAVAALSNGMETGLYRVNRIRLRLRAEAGDRAARTLRSMLADLRGMIIVCLIGYNGGVYLATVVVTMLVAASGWVRTPIAVEVATTAILTPIFFIFTDVTPKSLFAVEADRWTYPLAAPMQVAYTVLRGLGVIAVLKGISDLVLRVARRRGAAGANPFTPRQRLRAIIREGAAEGVITGYQDELFEKVLSLRELPIRRIMIPMRQVAAVPVNVTRQRFSRELRRHSYTRLPVYANHRENVVGIVRINDVLAQEGEPFDLGRIMAREFPSLSPGMTVNGALVRMQKARAAMAIVRDDGGKAVGVITVKDLVEEIVGELAAW